MVLVVDINYQSPWGNRIAKTACINNKANLNVSVNCPNTGDIAYTPVRYRGWLGDFDTDVDLADHAGFS